MNTTMSYEHFIQVAELRAQVMEAAARFDFRETPKALLFAERCHAGQRRKGPAKLPYIIHPLTMACHALSLGLAEDELIATALLHDTCEDCHLLPEELPVNAAVQEAVRRLTFFPEPGVPHARAGQLLCADSRQPHCGSDEVTGSLQQSLLHGLRLFAGKAARLYR